MNTTDLVQFLSADAPPRQTAVRPALAPSRHELAGSVRSSIFRLRTELIGAQRVDGSWAANSGGDAASSTLLVLLDAYLEREPSEQAVAAIFREQMNEGGWSLTRGGPFDLDRSVLAYYALKLAGESASRLELARARLAIRANGGADGCSATTRLWLALLGQIDFELCLPTAPEWLLMPGCTENLSASDACMMAARAVIWATRPTREISLSRGIRELFDESPHAWSAAAESAASLPLATFAGFWKGCERIGWLPLRRRALARADFLLTEATIEFGSNDVRCEELVWRRIALDALGHAKDSRVVAACERLLEHFAHGEPDDARSRPQTNLTHDTALAIEALRTSGVGVDDEPIAAAIDWLLAHRLKPAHPKMQPGEIAALVQVCGLLRETDESEAWALPPDIKLAGGRPDRLARHDLTPSVELDRFTNNLLGKAIFWQRPDGGWALGEKHGWHRRMVGMLHASAGRSPGKSDAASTGMMLARVARLPRADNRAAMERGVAFLRSSQRGDGGWSTSDGSSSVTATAWAIRGLIAAGTMPEDQAVVAGVNWLCVHQQLSGGWREANEHAVVDDESANAEDEVIETVAAVIALVQAGLVDDEATRRGIEVLINNDAVEERNLDALAWKLIALSQWYVAITRLGDRDEPASLRLVCDDATP